MKVFYHNDPDGKCSGSLVHYFYEKLDSEIFTADGDIEYIPMDYSLEEDYFPFDSIKENEQVWIVDFHISKDEVRKLFKITQNVIWIDHHKSAIEDFADFNDFRIEGIRISDNLAGCELTWIYLMMMLNGKKVNGIPSQDVRKNSWFNKMPQHVQLVGDRDVWRWTFGDTTKYFGAGIMAQDMEPTSDFWIQCHKNNFVNGIVQDGRLIEKYKQIWALEYYSKNGFTAEIDGHECRACNIGKIGSEFFGEDQEKYKILMTFVVDGKGIAHTSLYSTNEDIDVSKIAVKRGGGGHKGAAGFMIPYTELLKEILPGD